MTKQELIKILDEKIENAFNHRERVCMPLGKKTTKNDLALKFKLEGEIDAYTDIKNLLENEVLEDDK